MYVGGEVRLTYNPGWENFTLPNGQPLPPPPIPLDANGNYRILDFNDMHQYAVDYSAHNADLANHSYGSFDSWEDVPMSEAPTMPTESTIYHNAPINGNAITVDEAWRTQNTFNDTVSNARDPRSWWQRLS